MESYVAQQMMDVDAVGFEGRMSLKHSAYKHPEQVHNRNGNDGIGHRQQRRMSTLGQIQSKQQQAEDAAHQADEHGARISHEDFRLVEIESEKSQ